MKTMVCGMSNVSHLNVLRVKLSNEKVRLAKAKTDAERALRAVWVGQLEKEVKGEERFLETDLTAAELLEELYQQ